VSLADPRADAARADRQRHGGSRIPVATELGRKDRIWPAVTASIAVHAVAILFAVRASSLPQIELEQTPLRAKLVRLGEKKPEAQLPRKDEPAQPPAPATPAPPLAPPPPEIPPAPAAKPSPEPAPAAQLPPARRGPTARGAGTSSVDALLARTEQELQQQKLYGDPEGDPEGSSETGSPGDPYLDRLANAVHANYRLPTTISGEKLEAVFVLWIEANGRIVRTRLQRGSGNPSFDAGVERAIRVTTAPPPPTDRVEMYRKTGVQVTFTP
jgi:colicin import membrane protein/protein TonB